MSRFTETTTGGTAKIQRVKRSVADLLSPLDRLAQTSASDT